MRVLLDTNIWRYFVDDGAVGRLVATVKRFRHKLCVAPASLYEATHCESSDLRTALLRAITLPSWVRLLPEAFSESEEIKREILRCRPEWMRRTPELTNWRALRYDWVRSRGGAWDRAKEQVGLIGGVQNSSIQRARAETRESRDIALGWSPQWRTVPLKSILAATSQSEEQVEAWRHAGLAAFQRALSESTHPYADWLDGEVNLDLVLRDGISLRRFWLHEVQVERMPRQWQRWAFEFLQSMHKMSDGTPVDAQLGTYLLDVDLFISADRVLVQVAERCRIEAPHKLALTRRVPGGVAGVAATLAEIQRASRVAIA